MLRFSCHRPWKQPLKIHISRKATRIFDWLLRSMNASLPSPGPRAQVRSSTGTRDGGRERRRKGRAAHRRRAQHLSAIRNSCSSYGTPAREHSGSVYGHGELKLWPWVDLDLFRTIYITSCCGFSCHFMCNHAVEHCFHTLGRGLFLTIYRG